MGCQGKVTLEFQDIKTREIAENVFDIRLVASEGTARAMLHHKPGNAAGAVMVGGTGGGLDGPASIL